MGLRQLWRRQGLSSKLSLTNFVLVAAVMTALITILALAVARTLEHRQQTDLEHGLTVITQFVAASGNDLDRRIDRLAQAITQQHEGEISLTTNPWSSTPDAPILMLDGIVLNDNNRRLDAFTTATDAPATVFMKAGDDYQRVATSLKNEQGARVLGTPLDRNHPAYAALQAGQAYTGMATLFGRNYMTRYLPLRDRAGQTVGALFVGLDFSSTLRHIEKAIRELKIGESGYYYVVSSAPGADHGRLVIHPAEEGQNLLRSPNPVVRGFMETMLAQKSGSLRYEWFNPAADAPPRDKVVVFKEYQPWNWVVAASSYVDEATAETHALMLRFALIGLIAVAILSGVWFLLIRRLIVRPLDEAGRISDALAEGDLTVRIQHVRRDEIGHLFDAMNHMSESLTRMVHTVQAQAHSVAAASAQIAQGNQDLSSRTESQASALEEVAAAMEQLDSTVSQNAENARSADQVTQQARGVVTDSASAVQQVVQTMRGIDSSSQRIADITSVIDSIAFQTNILALNAAVEAARAGDHGRGFAVVAGEVRALAQRSAAAAREIKELIGTSVGQIHQGNVLANQTGTTMEQMLGQIGRVTSLISDISHASAEQSSGVAQVAEAVGSMDQSTQQNAALVEEMASAAQSLREQSDELVRVMAVFRLGGVNQSGPAGSATSVTSAKPARFAPKAPARPAVAAAPRSATAAPAAPASSLPAPGRPAPSAKPASRAQDDEDDWETF